MLPVGKLCGNSVLALRTFTPSPKPPVRLQLVGARHADALVLRAAHGYEDALPWSTGVRAALRT